MAVATQNPVNLPGAPRFETLEGERLYRKQRLARPSGCSAVRLRRGRGRPHHRARPRAPRPLLGEPVRHATSARSARPTYPGEPRRRGRRRAIAAVNGAAFAIHSQVHAARPDMDVAAAHAHSVYGKACSSLGRLLDPITQDACAFYGDHALFDDYTGVVLDTEEGERIAHALGENKAAILRNHGLLTVGESVDEAAWWFITMERTCQAQLLAEAAGTPVLIDPDQRDRDPEQVGSPHRRLASIPAALGAYPSANNPTCWSKKCGRERPARARPDLPQNGGGDSRAVVRTPTPRGGQTQIHSQNMPRRS